MKGINLLPLSLMNIINNRCICLWAARLFFFCPVLPFEPLRLITTKSLTRYLLHSYCVVQLASSFVNEVQLQRGSFTYKGAHFPPTLAHLNTRKLHRRRDAQT